MNPRLILPFEAVRPIGLADPGYVVDVPMWICEDPRRENDLDAYSQIAFRVDSGASHTTLSVAKARDHRVTIPTRRRSVRVRTARGGRAESTADGPILLRFVNLEAYSFVVQCVFVEDRSSDVPGLLGLNALRPVRGPEIRLTFDGAGNPDMPDGRLIIDLVPRPR